MDFLTTAKGMETEGIEYYLNLAESTSIKGLSGIFNFLANQEREHLKIFESMEGKAETPPFDGQNIFERAKVQFLEMSQHFETISTNSFDRKEIYEKALELEGNSISYYKEELGKIDDGGQLTVLKRIIKEEQSHISLIKAIMDFQKRPQEWLENAEWNHLDDY